MRHILSAGQFDRQEIEKVIKTAETMESGLQHKSLPQSLAGKIIACLFFEPSTRTRLSFETAALRLGGNVVDMENGSLSSSAVKGETIEDTTRMAANLVDLIVMRHPQDGAADQAAKVSPVPVINAGDGGNQHPTQALLDLYTIKKEKGKLENLSIAMVGDLLYGRTIHSTLTMLANFPGNKFYFVAPTSLALPKKYIDLLKSKNIGFEETGNMDYVADKADVVYMTRVQKERFSSHGEYEKLKDAYILNAAMLAKMKPDVVIMHALPRVNEIAVDVDADPRAAYFRQAKNGLCVRAALLLYALGMLD